MTDIRFMGLRTAVSSLFAPENLPEDLNRATFDTPEGDSQAAIPHV